MSTNFSYTESELLRDIAAGRDRSLVHLYDTYYEGLLLFALDLISERQQAEDITLTAFTKLWERPRQFERLEQVRSFLYQTIRHACYDYLDHLKVRSRARQEISDRTPIMEEGSVEARIMRAELFRQLYVAVSNLPERYRQVLQLTYIEEKTAAEIALLLSVTEEVVRQRKARGIRQLRELLGKEQLFLLFFATLVTDRSFDRFI